MQKQRNLFIGTIAFVIVTTLFWYLIYFNNLNNSLNEMTDSYKRIENENRRFTEIEKKLPTIEKEWNQLKNELTAMLDKIPTSGAYDDISKMLYSLIQQNKLVILTYNESVVAINEKEIVVPDTKERLVIEKYPIDIELRGSFLDFGNFLDQLSYTNYHLTTSNMRISQNRGNDDQDISFISYIYTKRQAEDLSYSTAN
jgi:Tfp pilus assembly protein PilO|tara:strand:- start:440 stop:1036 length:597 start_codon:yes stop_codon:yes gene_type:complete